MYWNNKRQNKEDNDASRKSWPFNGFIGFDKLTKEIKTYLIHYDLRFLCDPFVILGILYIMFLNRMCNSHYCIY